MKRYYFQCLIIFTLMPFTTKISASVRDLRDSRINSVDNPISFDLNVIQALFIRNFDIISILSLVLLLSSLIILPKLLKN